MGCCLRGTTEIKVSFVIFIFFNEHTYSLSHRNREVFLSGTSCLYVCVLLVNQFRHECTKQQSVPRFILTQSKLISFHAITSSFIFPCFDSWVITSNRLCLVCGCVNLFCLFGFPNSCQSSESLTCGVCVSLSLLILYFCSWDSFRHLVWLSLTVLKRERGRIPSAMILTSVPDSVPPCTGYTQICFPGCEASPAPSQFYSWPSH